MIKVRFDKCATSENALVCGFGRVGQPNYFVFVLRSLKNVSIPLLDEKASELMDGEIGLLADVESLRGQKFRI